MIDWYLTDWMVFSGHIISIHRLTLWPQYSWSFDSWIYQSRNRFNYSTFSILKHRWENISIAKKRKKGWRSYTVCTFPTLILKLYVFQQTVGIPIGTNCAPLLADLFLYSYEADFLHGLLEKNEKKLALFFISHSAI